jgi:hypothetical protein
MPHEKDVTLYEFVKFLLHRLLDARNEIAAIQVALLDDHPDLNRRVRELVREFQDSPKERELRHLIDQLDHTDVLDALNKFEEPIQ